MKKILSLFLSVLFVLSFVSCNGNSEENNQNIDEIGEELVTDENSENQYVSDEDPDFREECPEETEEIKNIRTWLMVPEGDSIVSVEVFVSEETPSKMLDALSEYTGLNFSYVSAELTDRITIVWADDATFFNPKECDYSYVGDFPVTDYSSVLRFMMDAAYATLHSVYAETDPPIYFVSEKGDLDLYSDYSWKISSDEPYNGIFDYYSCTNFPYERVKYYKLTEPQQKIYDEIYEKLINFESFSYERNGENSVDFDDVLAAWTSLSFDYPQYRNYIDMKEIFAPDTTVAAFEFNYFCWWDESLGSDVNEIGQGILRFNSVCDEIVSAMPENSNVHEKYLYLAAELSNRCVYDDAFSKDIVYFSYGALVDGLAVCQGYAEAYQILCQKADLWCTSIIGSGNGQGHKWNLIKLPMGTYYIDVTWADYGNEIYGSEWLKYMFMTQETMLNTYSSHDGTVADGPFFLK